MLKQIERQLNREHIETQWVAATEATPLEQLGVALSADEKNRPRQLWITPLSGLEEELGEGVSLWQFFVELPFKPIAAAQPGLNRLVLMLNNLIPLGAFGVREPEAVILYRYVWVQESDLSQNSNPVIDVVLLISYLLDQFSGLIESVASGHKTPEQIMSDLQSGRSSV